MLLYIAHTYSVRLPDTATVQVWNHLVIKAANKPVSGNMGGSYLTFFSSNGLTFGIINIIGNFGTVFCDQAYWVCSVPPLLPCGVCAVALSSSCPCLPLLFAHIFLFYLLKVAKLSIVYNQPNAGYSSNQPENMFLGCILQQRVGQAQTRPFTQDRISRSTCRPHMCHGHAVPCCAMLCHAVLCCLMINMAKHGLLGLTAV